jgi:hypothetical protein
MDYELLLSLTQPRQQRKIPNEDKHSAPNEDKHSAPNEDKHSAPNEDKHSAPNEDKHGAPHKDNHNFIHRTGYCSSSGQNYSSTTDYPTSVVYCKSIYYSYTVRHSIRVDMFMSDTHHRDNEIIVRWPSQEEIDDLSVEEFELFTECADYVTSLYLKDVRVPTFKHRSLDGKIVNINQQLLANERTRNILKEKLSMLAKEYFGRNNTQEKNIDSVRNNGETHDTQMSDDASPNKSNDQFHENNEQYPENNDSDSFSDFDESSDPEKQ